MNTKYHYRRRSQQRRQEKPSGIKHNPKTSDDFGEEFTNFYVHALDKILRTNLQNFYRHDKENGVIHCLICERNINVNDAFEHIVSSTHELNKLFHNFIQKRKQSGDVNYIVSPKWAKCRYCSNVRIPAAFTEERMNHIQNSLHLTRKQYCLNRVTGSGQSLVCVKPSAQTSEPRVKPMVEPLGQSNANLSTKGQSVAGPSEEIWVNRTDFNKSQNIDGLERWQHFLRGIDKDFTIEQDVRKRPDQGIVFSAQRSSINKSRAILEQHQVTDRFRVNEGRQLLEAKPEEEIRKLKTEVVSQKPIRRTSQFRDYQTCIQNANSESRLNRKSTAIPKQHHDADRFRVNYGRQLLAVEPEVKVNTTNKVALQRPTSRMSQFREYQICPQNSYNGSHSNRLLPAAEPVSLWQSIFSYCFPCLGNRWMNMRQ